VGSDLRAKLAPTPMLRPTHTEYNVGNYYREFALDEDVDESKIKATLRSGVLELELPGGT
jgi:HSP20 family molecular chaperone IbpA